MLVERTIEDKILHVAAELEKGERPVHITQALALTLRQIAEEAQRLRVSENRSATLLVAALWEMKPTGVPETTLSELQHLALKARSLLDQKDRVIRVIETGGSRELPHGGDDKRCVHGVSVGADCISCYDNSIIEALNAG